jgi:4-hydroxyacetophenone monooxygenase
VTACNNRPMRKPPVAASIVADDETIVAALREATVGALLPAVADLTGDLSVLRPDLQPDPDNILDPQAGLSAAQVAEAREVALRALIAHRDAGSPAPPPLDPERLRTLMSFAVGEKNVDEYFDLLLEELAPNATDMRAPDWRLDQVAPDTTMQAVVIGAGMSGLLAAYRLRQVGVEVVVLEKNPDVGGTWLENTYPGCRVDVPNFLYSYSFAPAMWPQHFSSQDVLREYFADFATEHNLRDLVRFGTEVRSARWDEGDDRWHLEVSTPDGAGTVTANILVSAVGQLNRPNVPDLPGLDSFAGPVFHSARWDHEVELAGKRVAVIGTGASAMQFIPEIAPATGHLTVFQRTPAWLVPSPDYHDVVTDGQRWLFEHLPSYTYWFRLWLFWRTHEGMLVAAEADPDWPGAPQSVSALNDMVRMVLNEYLTSQFGSDPELLAKVTPAYPPISKRVVRDNGVWASTLLRDDVDLVTDGITAVTPDGVTTSDGVHHPADVIILGTGFTASDFLMPMQVTGVGGVDLHEQWSGDATAYLGMTIPNFPNLFCMYGPNTNIVINGSIIFFSECETHYITESVRMLATTGSRSMDVRADVHDAFADRIDAANRRMAWGVASVNTWYKNAKGRVTQNWPFSLLEYWRATRTPEPSDYHLK